MKKILIAMMLMPLMTLADTEIVNGIEWTFTISESKATVGGANTRYCLAIPKETVGAIEIPSTLGGCSVTSIRKKAFWECSGLTSVTIPSSVTSIGDYAFDGCSGLTSVTISSSVTSIGSSAFSGCSGLTSVTIPSSVTSIREYAFYGCGGLTSVTIPSSVTSIREYAFYGCGGLTSVTIPEGVTSIGDYAFDGCGGLTSVTIPSSVTSIGEYAFYGCGGLTSVTIPEGVTSIGDYAFSHCSKLTSVTIPSSVTSIGDDAFSGCRGLTSFSVDPANEFYCSLNGLFCSKDGRTLIAGVNGNVTIPEGVTSIGGFAFLGCSGLTTVTIPSSVTSIGYHAFSGCSSLKDVYFQGVNPPSLGVEVFYGCDTTDLLLHAPKGWKGRSRFLSGIYLEVESESIQQVNMTITNVVVNYILNSVQPEFAIPATSDTGFVNIITEVKGGAVAVPASWADNYPTFTTKFGADFTKALAMKTGKKDGAGNDMFVWQDYVAGTDPTKEDDVFKASITVVEGKVTISYSPELDDERKSLRKYTILGKKSLLDTDWTIVQEGQEAEYNFFKVSVEMR